MALKIGLVSGEYPPMQGGVGAFTRELARELHRQGHAIHIFTSRETRPDMPVGRRLSRVFEPVDLGYAQLHPRARHWRFRENSLMVDLALRYHLDALNIQFQAAAYNMRHPAIYFAPQRLRGVLPVVVTFHDLRVPYLFPKAGRVRRWAVQWLAQKAAGAIATNDADAARLRDWCGAERVRCIPIGSNISVHPPDPATTKRMRRELGLKPADCLLAYFGFLHPGKGADTLIQALAQLPAEMHLVFIGGRTGASDSARNQAFLTEIEAQIEQAGLEDRVHWTGFVKDDQVSAYLHAADMVILPYKDGVSLRRGTLMAALAHARPVISTHPQSPIPELHHGKNIWLVSANDPAGLADAIDQLVAEPPLRHQLAANAGEIAHKFTWDTIAEQTAEFMADLVNQIK